MELIWTIVLNTFAVVGAITVFYLALALLLAWAAGGGLAAR